MKKNTVLKLSFTKFSLDLSQVHYLTLSTKIKIIFDRLGIIVLVAIASLLLDGILLLAPMPTPAGTILDTNPYTLAENRTSDLPSRSWASYAIKISKSQTLYQPASGRLLAYIGSVYDEVRNKTGSSSQASLATAMLFNNFFPDLSSQTGKLLINLTRTDPANSLSPESKSVLDSYLDRSKNDGFLLSSDKKIPLSSTWHPEGLGAGSGAKFWKTWNAGLDIKIPPPVSLSSPLGIAEIDQIKRETRERSPDEDESIFFWSGFDNLSDLNSAKNSIAGIWQNILFAEAPRDMDDAHFASVQKILGQAVADSLITSWKAKYIFFSAPPSIVVPGLDFKLRNWPYPSYISEVSTVSSAAAEVLSAFFPDKKKFFDYLVENASNSRLLAGAEFQNDIDEGRLVGQRIGQETLHRLLPAKYPNPSTGTLDAPLVSKVSEFISLTTDQLRDYARNVVENIHNLVGPKPIFEEVSQDSGVYDQAELGAAWGDYDNDGYLDLLTSQGLFHNLKNGKFAKVASAPPELRAPAFWGDYNNDGCEDVYVVRSGPSDSPGLSDKLFRNNCNGTFSDVTVQAKMDDHYHGSGAAWGDYNNDGCLDIYIANRGALGSQHFDDPNGDYQYEPNILYRNNCDGTFTDVTQNSGTTGLLDCPVYRSDGQGLKRLIKVSFQPVWFDYNNDHKPDLFVVNDTYMSPLYKNNGDGTFNQVTEQMDLCGAQRDSNMGVAVGDFNGDGFLDLYVTDNGNNYFWENEHGEKFKNVIQETGANELGYGWGTEALDYDNDGNLDILVVNGNNRIPDKSYYVPKLKHNDLDELLKNNGNMHFIKVGLEAGFNISEVKYSAAVADYNNDGFPDIFIPIRSEKRLNSHSLLYRNRGNKNHWLTIQLIGTKSNRDAVGARITLKSQGKSQIREIVSGSSHVSQSSPWPTFGLGASGKVDSIEVSWPSGLTQQINLGKIIDQKVTIIEADTEVHTGSTH